jgi:hypothetical protein
MLSLKVNGVDTCDRRDIFVAWFIFSTFLSQNYHYFTNYFAAVGFLEKTEIKKIKYSAD